MDDRRSLIYEILDKITKINSSKYKTSAKIRTKIEVEDSIILEIEIINMQNLLYKDMNIDNYYVIKEKETSTKKMLNILDVLNSISVKTAGKQVFDREFIMRCAESFKKSPFENEICKTLRFIIFYSNVTEYNRVDFESFLFDHLGCFYVKKRKYYDVVIFLQNVVKEIWEDE